MSPSVRLSVILPVKNGQRHLDAALHSVHVNCGAQDELIVIDDCSTDDTANILRAFKSELKVTVLQGRGQGPIQARNDGLKVARGHYLTFLDHDDYWPIGRVQGHLDVFVDNASTFVVTGKTQYVTDLPGSSEPQPCVGRPAIFHVHLGASTFKRSLFDTVGGFDETLTYSEDHDLFFRIREAGKRIDPLDQISLYYRVHESNMTRDKPIADLQLLRVIQKSLDRRRQNSEFDLSSFPKTR